MTTTTLLQPKRPFTPAECMSLAVTGIIAPEELEAVLSGARRYTVDEYLAMVKADILHKEERIELIDGEIIVMAPIGEYHESSTDHLTMLLLPPLIGRARVRTQGSIRLNDRTRPEPDVSVLRERALSDARPYSPSDVYFLIEVADTSLRRDSGPKLAIYAAADVPEVWIANLRAREVRVFTNPSGSSYSTVRTYRSGDSISPGAFPDLSLAVDDFMPPTPGPDVEIA